MGDAPGEKQGPGTQEWVWGHRHDFGDTDMGLVPAAAVAPVQALAKSLQQFTLQR